MKKTILFIMIGLLLCLTACGQRNENALSSDEALQDEMTYMSSDGFQLRYNPQTIESTEINEHSAQFVYIGESAGTNMLTVSYVPDKQPEEVLYDVTSAWGNEELINRREGFFPGTDDKWGYFRDLTDAENGSGLCESAIAGEYNDGVLLFEITEHQNGEDEIDMAVSDTFSEMINSITYEDFTEQTMYSYYSGTYTGSDEDGTYSVTLNEDHTGTLDFQDTISILWGSNQITAADGSFEYEFRIEGNSLNLNYDGTWMTFEK